VAGDTDLTDQDDDTPTTKPMLGDEIEGIHMFLNTCCYELERKTTSLQIAISQIPPA